MVDVTVTGWWPLSVGRRGGRGGLAGLVPSAALPLHLRLEVRADGDSGVGHHPARDSRLPAARLGLRRARLLAPEHLPSATTLVQVRHI